MSTEKSPKISKIFQCESCDYKCSKNSEWTKHILTAKHKKSTESTFINEKIANSYCCEHCGNTYKERTGLWRHSKKCQKSPKVSEFEPVKNNMQVQPITDMSSNIIMELLKQNSEFKDLIVDQHKIICENNKQIVELAGKAGSYNTNCHNKTFNLQVFLNEQCKDALNITDFVNQIKLQLSDLDMIGRVGYTEGMSKIIVRNLKELDVSKRPIHCSDLKREVMYIKDKDAWEKENGENVKLKNAIKIIEHKNVRQLPQWKAENPESDDYDSKKHMDYHKIVIESMGGATNEDENKKREKIISNIAKEVVIDKNLS
jgi:ribosomal protein L37AE/L43A